MAKDWIQRRNTDFLGQARNFSNLIQSDPGAYGIDPADAALLVAENADFAAKYRIPTDPHTRTSPAIIARDEAREILAERMRRIAAQIRANPAVTDVMRLQLTLTVPGRADGAPDGPPKTW